MSQADEDRARLPDDVKRIGYDADTSRYTFMDRKGTIYKSEPGSEYGKLSPVQDPIQRFEQERPQAFNVPGTDNEEGDDDGPRFAPTTFEQFVPRHLITSPKTSPDDPDPSSTSKIRRRLTLKSSSRTSKSGLSPPSSSTSSQSKRNSYPTSTKEYPTSEPPTSVRIKDAVRRSGFGLPKMQGVVQGLRRSVTGATKKGGYGGGGHGRSKSESQGELVDGGYAPLLELEEKK